MGDLSHEVVACLRALALWVGLCVLALTTLLTIAALVVTAWRSYCDSRPRYCAWCLVVINPETARQPCRIELEHGYAIVEPLVLLCEKCRAVDAPRRVAQVLHNLEDSW